MKNPDFELVDRLRAHVEKLWQANTVTVWDQWTKDAMALLTEAAETIETRATWIEINKSDAMRRTGP